MTRWSTCGCPDNHQATKAPSRMKTIYKYAIETDNVGLQLFAMPQGATVLTAQDQAGGIAVWAEVTTSRPPEDRFFYWQFTGQPLPWNGTSAYIATVQLGRLVYHIYEALPA